MNIIKNIANNAKNKSLAKKLKIEFTQEQEKYTEATNQLTFDVNNFNLQYIDLIEQIKEVSNIEKMLEDSKEKLNNLVQKYKAETDKETKYTKLIDEIKFEKSIFVNLVKKVTDKNFYDKIEKNISEFLSTFERKQIEFESEGYLIQEYKDRLLYIDNEYNYITNKFLDESHGVYSKHKDKVVDFCALKEDFTGNEDNETIYILKVNDILLRKSINQLNLSYGTFQKTYGSNFNVDKLVEKQIIDKCFEQ